jgi:hypothetical protein
MLKLKFYSDPGHGWLACKITLLRQLGIVDDISNYSYRKGDTVYLEEDCDAPKLLKALNCPNSGVQYGIESRHTNKRSRIRSYNSFYFCGSDT